MMILALESSATACSVALTRDGNVLAQAFQHSGLTHSRTLLPMVDNVLNSCGEIKDSVSGEVRVALPAGRENLENNGPDTILVCGNQPEVVRHAMENGVNCVIVCQTEVPQEILEMETETCIISTPFDAYQVVR